MSDFVELDGRRYRKAFVVKSRLLIEGQEDTVITVECPLCPRRHVHGGTRGQRGDGGHKSAHCASKTPDSTGLDWLGYIVWDDRPLESWEL